MKKKIAHFRQQWHNSKLVIFQERILKVLKCYNFLWVQGRHSCCQAVANCVMALCLLKVHLQTFLSIPITQKCQILSRVTLVANERRNTLRKGGIKSVRNLAQKECSNRFIRVKNILECNKLKWRFCNTMYIIMCVFTYTCSQKHNSLSNSITM